MDKVNPHLQQCSGDNLSIFVVLTFILMELTEDKLEYIAFVARRILLMAD